MNRSKLLVLLEPQRRRCKTLETGNLIIKFASFAFEMASSQTTRLNYELSVN